MNNVRVQSDRYSGTKMPRLSTSERTHFLPGGIAHICGCELARFCDEFKHGLSLFVEGWLNVDFLNNRQSQHYNSCSHGCGVNFFLRCV